VSATRYQDFAVLVRFNTNGMMDAMSSNTYQASQPVEYSAGTRYHFRITVDIPAKRYSAYVTPPGVPEILLASGFSFRSEQAAASQLSYWGLISEAGGHTVCSQQIKSGNKADTNGDNCVQMGELIAFIQSWKNAQTIQLAEVMEAIRLWKQGC
jgi:hypothetical protein